MICSSCGKTLGKNCPSCRRAMVFQEIFDEDWLICANEICPFDGRQARFFE